jgi:uncharacterized membrane protein YgcG
MLVPLSILRLFFSFLFVAVASNGLAGSPEMGAAAVDPPAKPSHYFNDFASLVDPETAQGLNQRLEDFERQTSNQILVLIYPSLPANTVIEDFALAAFRAWKPGQQGRNNGVILFVFVNDRKVRIQTGYGMEATLTNEICKRIISDEITPRFQKRDFGGGLTAAINAMITATKDAYTGTGKTVAEQNAADRLAAQQASPTEASLPRATQDEIDAVRTWHGPTGWDGCIGGDVVENAIKKNIDDPGSFQYAGSKSHWNFRYQYGVPVAGTGYNVISVRYRAKNTFGALTLYQADVTWVKGDVTEIKWVAPNTLW